MPGSREEDLDWLYGRERRPGSAEPREPEPTRVFGEPLASSGSGAGHSPFADRPPGQGTSAPPSYPAAPAYGQGPWTPSSAGPSAWNAPQTAPPAQTAPPPPPPGAPPGERRARRRRRPVRTVLRTLLVLLLAAVVWLVGVPVYAWSHVGRVDDAPAGKRPGLQPGQTYLLVGSDSRKGLTKAERKRLGTGATEGQRTDTIMLLHRPLTGQPVLVSVPRDSYVPIPGHGTNKINAAYAFGGPELLVQTIEADTGLRVDGYLEIGFGGFVNVIDALGGIRMCLPAAIKDADSHLDLPKGCQTLSGVEALGYVRMRKADPRGDLGRVERQRQMLSAIAAKAASPAAVLNPVRYWRLCNAATEGVAVGRETSFVDVGLLALAMRSVSSGEGLALTVPVANPGAVTPAGSAVLWDEAKAKAMFGEIARGDTSGLKKYATK